MITATFGLEEIKQALREYASSSKTGSIILAISQ
jgi:hypothetical protein